MAKPFLFLTSLLLILIFTDRVYSQHLLVSQSRQQELLGQSVQLTTSFTAARQQAMQMAAKYNWPTVIRKKNGALMVLQGTNSIGFPVYLKTNDNIIAAATTQTNTVQPGGSLGLNLSGAGSNLVNKLAIWDGGWVLTNHQEFAGKNIAIKDAGSSVIEHATHVAGTLLAKGVYAPAKGMAFGATSLLSYDFNNDIAEMTAASGSLLLSNHSYGGVSGWSFNDDLNRWEWYGLPGDTEDYTFGFYDSRAQSWDKIAYAAPYYLIVESAGNARGETGPAVGQDYWGYRSRTDQTLVDKGARPANISNNDGYDVLNSTANAKNVLTVGAVNQLPFGPVSSSNISVAYFSGWGPTDDGRVKPDVCGMGVNVLSTDNSSTTSYVTLSGTSMSAPNVTGSLYLLQEYYAQKNAGNFMRAATLKGLACHTAFDAGNAGPDYVYGWGLLNTKAAAQAITDNNTKSLIKEASLSQGQSQTYNVIASGNGILKATISWTDVQGTPTGGTTINDRTPKLVNDLDIRISDGTNTFNPWVLDPANPSAPATTGDNIRDNVEQVSIANTVPGKSYTITISHKGTLQSGTQAYSLIVTGAGGTAYCASAPASSADSRINNFTLSNINNSTPAGCTTYTNLTSQTINLEQGKTYPLSLTLGTCGANFNKIARVYIDYNGDGVFDPVAELAATTGIINGTGTYTTNITIPGNVTAASYSLLRVVLTETDDAAAVAPCGTYAKGETQDYRVQFTQTAIDAGAIAVSSNTPGGACAGPTNLTVRLKNFGSSPVSNIPVKVTVVNPDNSTTVFNETYTSILSAGAEDDFTLQGTFNTVSGASYAITAATNLAADPVTANNTVTSNIVIGSIPSASNLQAYYCTDTRRYILSGDQTGLLWYKNINDAIPIAAGSPAYTTQQPVNNTFYAGVNDFSATVGPAAKSVFTGGSYNQFTPSVYVSTRVPVVIESARLYIGNAGKITFTVSNNNGQTISSSTINVDATRTSSALTDDPNDQGKVYPLNLLLPDSGQYIISLTYADGATIYRSNSGVSGYPYSVGNVFSITGNNAGSPTNPASVYYYFYNMQIKSAGCSSAARQPVTVTKPAINQKDTLLMSNFTNGNQWYEDDKPIAGATGQTFAPAHSGNYAVGITLNSGCLVMSDVFAYAVVALHPDNSAIGLSVYPVPATRKLNVVFNAPANNQLTLSLVNNAGMVVYTQKQNVVAGNFSTIMDVSRQITGTYILRVQLGNKTYGHKVLIVSN